MNVRIVMRKDLRLYEDGAYYLAFLAFKRVQSEGALRRLICIEYNKADGESSDSVKRK